jgi:ubiquinone/menaquinone biosynthesis C-methylase UbiE
MKIDTKANLKKLLKIVGLYKPAVYIYCRLERLYIKSEHILKYLYSPFLNAAFKRSYLSDGLPFPPLRLVYLVTNTYSYKWFYETGAVGLQCIRDVLKRNNLDIDKFESILDFGCGCGRIIRHWKARNSQKIYGTDYNPVLIAWCQKNLSFASFEVNDTLSGLIYEDEKFDFIYAISVFTHLTEKSGHSWMSELYRVLKPGGTMYVTFMGTTRAPYLRPELRDRFESGHIVVTGEEHSGKNICAAYHPEQYVRKILAKQFRVLDFIPGGAKDANQDVFLLKKETIAS